MHLTIRIRISFCPILFTLLCLNKSCGLDIVSNIVEIPKHVEVFIFSESFAEKCSTVSLSAQLTPGISISARIGKSRLQNELQNVSQYNGQTLTIICPENLASFYNSLKMVSNILDQQLMYMYWNSRYVVMLPIILQNNVEAAQFLENDNFTAQVRRINAKSDVYILISYRSGLFALWETYTITNITFNHKIKPNEEPSSIALNFANLTNKIARRSNFQGAEVTAAAANDPVFTLETKFTPDLKRFESGSAVDRYWILRDSLNFSERAILGGWTSEDRNGQLTGSGIYVMKGEVDLGIAQTPMTNTKKVHIDFLQPTDDRTLKIFFVQPKRSQYRNMYWSSFKPNLWIAIAVVWTILIILIHVVGAFKLWICNEKFPSDQHFVKESLIWAIGTFTQHGAHVLPASYSFRIIHLTAHITALVCFCGFTASIVAFLSVKSSPMKSIEDIMNASYHIYSNSNSTPVRSVLPILEAQPGYPDEVIVNEYESIQRSLRGGHGVIAFAYVFFIQARVLKYSDVTLCQTLDSLPVIKVPLRHGMIVRKGSPYREYFNHRIILMKESGCNHRFKLTYTTSTEASCLDYSIGFHESLGLEDLMSAPYILLMGSALSFLFFSIENLFHWRARVQMKYFEYTADSKAD